MSEADLIVGLDCSDREREALRSGGVYDPELEWWFPDRGLAPGSPRAQDSLMSYATDPNALCQPILVYGPEVLTGIVTVDIPDGSLIDLSNWEHVLLLISCSSGTTAGAITITPKDSDANAAAGGRALDGTNGTPDARRSYPNGVPAGAAGVGRQVVIRTTGLKRYLNVEVALAATGTARFSIWAILFGQRSTEGRNVELDATELLLT